MDWTRNIVKDIIETSDYTRMLDSVPCFCYFCPHRNSHYQRICIVLGITQMR